MKAVLVLALLAAPTSRHGEFTFQGDPASMSGGYVAEFITGSNVRLMMPYVGDGGFGAHHEFEIGDVGDAGVSFGCVDPASMLSATPDGRGGLTLTCAPRHGGGELAFFDVVKHVPPRFYPRQVVDEVCR